MHCTMWVCVCVWQNERAKITAAKRRHEGWVASSSMSWGIPLGGCYFTLQCNYLGLLQLYGKQAKRQTGRRAAGGQQHEVFWLPATVAKKVLLKVSGKGLTIDQIKAKWKCFSRRPSRDWSLLSSQRAMQQQANCVCKLTTTRVAHTIPLWTWLTCWRASWLEHASADLLGCWRVGGLAGWWLDGLTGYGYDGVACLK